MWLLSAVGVSLCFCMVLGYLDGNIGAMRLGAAGTVQLALYGWFVVFPKEPIRRPYLLALEFMLMFVATATLWVALKN